MWGKWIDCRVRPGARAAFAAGQRRWAAIADQPGLVGQVGGWSPADGRALVLGLWADEPAYERFMGERHDAVAETAAQRDTWTAIRVAAGPVVQTVPISLPDALEHAELLRVADCLLRPGRADHFLDVQREVWSPGMAAAGGLLAGTVTRLAADRYLVTTLWSSAEAHAAYTAEVFPGLRARADVPADVETLTGHVLPLEPSWRVLGPGPALSWRAAGDAPPRSRPTS
ncbi:DUF4937 domain-containing protein [Streptomyces sp. FH025]|uniref:DUF4937 domain-containing protein n=1 Tax=Streptomyces sp. FH025 TaxID=2815937 RepID=UPI001A9CDCC7|nr:DUF4937 domain-containing protein [Streptomyces sp. FH025]MBO1416583.1 DUF4937 domain-containing protein [Streptomyces sp. FH025]